MKKLTLIAAVFGLVYLTACSGGSSENAGDATETNTEATAEDSNEEGGDEASSSEGGSIVGTWKLRMWTLEWKFLRIKKKHLML